MPRLPRIPAYRRDKPTGQAVVTLGGRDHYLGRYGTAASRRRYDRAVAEWSAAGRPAQISQHGQGLTVTALIARFWQHARKDYRHPDATPTSELSNFRSALRPPHRLRHTAATRLRKEFGIEAARVVLGHRSPLVTEIYAEIDRQKAAEDIVVAYEEARGWQCQRVGHLKIGFDIRSIGPADPQTGYRDPVEGIRRIEVKGCQRGQPIRLTTNEWYKAAQLGDSYWLYVVWDPLSEDRELVTIQNPAARLDRAKREVVAARFFEIPAEAVRAAVKQSEARP